MGVGLLWVSLMIILNLQMKYTINKYSSKVHNRFKPALVMLTSLPLCILGGYIHFNNTALVYYAIMIAATIGVSMIYNKLIESVPMYIMNSLLILVSVETFVIDILIGRIDISTLAIISTIIKSLGVWLCVKYKADVDKKAAIKGFLVVFVLSLVSIIRMYTVSYIIKEGMITNSYVSLISQLGVFLFANYLYRKEELKITKELVKDYSLQAIVTFVADITFFYLLSQGVNNTIDYQIIIMLCLMMIENKLKINYLKIVGAISVVLGLIITYL